MFRPLRDLILTFGFVGALCLPTADAWFGLDPTPDLDEKRELAAMPPLSWAELEEFPARYEAYFDDHFGFRRLLVRWNAITKVGLLRESTTPKVTLGDDGWLFSSADEVREDHRGDVTLAPAVLGRWRRGLEARQSWFAERNIGYYFAVAPDKATVYPELLPPDCRGTGAPTRFEQIQSHLDARSDFRIVAMRDAIVPQKPRGLLYFPTDTHWTSLGGYFGYAELIDHARATDPAMSAPLELDDLGRTKGALSGDLAKMLGLNQWLVESVDVLFVQLPADASMALNAKPLDHPPGAALIATNPRGTRTALVLRDSFTTTIAEMLATHFETTALVDCNSSHFDAVRRLVDEFQPDVVFEIRVERNMRFALQLDDELRAARDRRK